MPKSKNPSNLEAILSTLLDNKLKPLKDDIASLKQNTATKNDLIGLAHGTEIDNLTITFTDNLNSWKTELYTKIDKVLGRVKTAEEENAILQAKEEGRQEIKKVLERRVTRIEKHLNLPQSM